MATYNIYSYSNGEDNSPVVATIVLNDDDTEVVSVASDDPEIKTEVESVLSEYMEDGMSALSAVLRYGGSYGEVKVSSSSDQVKA